MVVSDVLTPFGQALLGLVITGALAAFSYLMGRLASHDRQLAEMSNEIDDVKSRVYGREHDRTDPGGFLGEVKIEFGRVHRRLDTLHTRIDRMARTFNQSTRRGYIRRGKENSHDRRDPDLDGRNVPWIDEEFDDPDRPDGDSGFGADTD